MKLWPHQTRALDQVKAGIQAGQQRICVTAPTGAGKSLIMRLLLKWGVDRGWNVSLVTNRRLLLEQTSKGLDADGIEHGKRAAGHANDYWQQVQLSSIQTEDIRVYKRKTWDLHDSQLVLVDEAHNETASRAERFIADYVKAGAAVVGFTATPCGIGHLYEHLIQAGVNSELRACGALVPAHTYGPDEPDLRHIKKTKTGEYVEGDLVKAIMTPTIFGRVFTWAKKLNPDWRPAILFAPSVAGSLYFAEQFNNKGVAAAHIDGDTIYVGGKQYESTQELRDEVLQMSKDGRVKVLCNRFVLREGIDCPWLAHGIAATAFGSVASYLQSGGRLLRAHPTLDHVIWQDHGGCLDEETEILTKRGWRGIKDGIADDEIIGTMNIDTNEFEWCDNLGTIHKPRDSGMKQVACEHINLRVTDYHNMVMSADVRSVAWKKVTAGDLAKRGSGWIIPTSCNEIVEPCDLSDDEIGFIGWFLTDGNLDSARIRISQATNSPMAHHEHILKCIKGCNFRHTIRRRIRRKVKGKCFSAEVSDETVYSVSSGRKSPGGWDRLSEWIDKDFPMEVFERLDKRQFKVLLHAMNLGDGLKHTTYNQQTTSICTVRKTVADNLQSLAVRRGHRCNMHVQCANGCRDMYILHIRDSSKATIAKGELCESDPVPGETVWCVQTKNGTIITRRNGKVAIMGNSWWKHGSLNCDRTWELGSDAKKIAEEREKSILDKKEPEPIVCPQCAKVRQTGKICPSCGYESEKKKRMVMQVDGSLVPYHGDIFKPRVVKMKDDTEKHWESIYYRAKKSKKSMSWKQAYGLFYHEHGYWPPKDMGLMPKSEFQWERRVCETPYADLNQSDRI